MVEAMYKSNSWSSIPIGELTTDSPFETLRFPSLTIGPLEIPSQNGKTRLEPSTRPHLPELLVVCPL